MAKMDKNSENNVVKEEVKMYLQDQIKQLSRENALLHKENESQDQLLKENNNKLKDIKVKSFDLKNSNNNKNELITATQLASSKIVELTKKLREKNCEVECLKTKCSKLEATILENDHFNQSFIEVKQEKEMPTNELEDQIKKLQDKFNFTNGKFLEIKNENFRLKNYIKNVKRVLHQEIGDNFESLLNNSNSTWRGRAQIICDLMQKNNELKEKLKTLNEKGGVSGSIDPKEMAKLEQKIKYLQIDNTEIKNAYDDLYKKYNSLKTKLKMTENDYGLMKTRYFTVKEQSERDQGFIENLSSHLTQSKDMQNEGFKTRDKKIKQLKFENDILLTDIEKLKCQYDNLNKQLDQKCHEIEDIKEQNKESSEHKVDKKLVNRLEAEKLRLLELIEIEKKRFQVERDNHSETHSLLRFEKQRAAKFEASLARMELDQNVSKTGCYSSTTSLIRAQDNISKLKDELELAQEQILALKNRLEIEKKEKNSDFKEFSKILQELCNTT